MNTQGNTQQKQKSELIEVEGVIRSISFVGTTGRGTPFVRLKFKTNNGRKLKLSKFDTVEGDVERLIDIPVRVDYSVSYDSLGNEYFNIDGEFEPVLKSYQQAPQQIQHQQPQQQAPQQQQPQTQAVYQQQPQQQPQQAYSQPQQQVQQQPVYQQPAQQQPIQQPQNQSQPPNGFDDDDIPDIPF
ncbi:hypothetical protein [Endozoicomonas sp.]|uniref:hypothetical protein n=1 Tax=Endozoicomonas sp. TaxID=1892382 RepID=UPI0028860EC8|nr:hypothetical protein [Endozoicomonas sp.]